VAPTDLILTPRSWRRPLEWLPVLSAFIAAVPAERDVTLNIDARSADLDAVAVRQLIATACDYLAEGADFANVVLLEGSADAPASCEQVHTAPELLERISVLAPAPAETPDAIVRHARWSKALVDVLQAQIDRAIFAATPRPAQGRMPLVSVRIPTFGATELLVERAIPSVLAGIYPNIELLICSDGPQPHARDAVARFEDSRVRYLELPERPRYPSRPEAFWQTAGTFATNELLDAAKGEYIAPLDHDDAFTIDHIPRLLAAMVDGGGDFAYGQAMREEMSGGWRILGHSPLTYGFIVHATVMYSRRLGHLRYDPHAWLLDEPGDWNMWRRMRNAGAAIRHVPAPVAVHWRERSSIGGRNRDPEVRIADTANDVLQTSAAALMQISSRVHGGMGLATKARAAAPARVPQRRRLALLDTHFPLRLSGFRLNEAQAMLDLLAGEMDFFSVEATGEGWSRPVHSLADFPRLAGELGITDAYCVFLNLACSLLGLQGHPGASTCGGMRPLPGVAPALWNHGIRFHTTLYPGGGLVAGTDPELIRALAERSQTVFTNAGEVLAAVPEAIRTPGPMATEFYGFKPRDRGAPLRIAFAADDRPRKGLDTALAALEQLDGRFHLHIAGPNERYIEGVSNPDRVTLHGFLAPDALRELYWSCDVFVSPVRPEGPDGPPGEVGLIDGFPTSTACEALASGCALVSSNPRDDDWILAADEHYLQIPVGDPGALSQALDRLERDRDLRDRLAEHGAARIRELMNARGVAQAKLRAMGLV
jgi:hypothetical protein